MVAASQLAAPDRADQLEHSLLTKPLPEGLRFITEADVVTQHFFAPHLYARALTRPAGALIIGHRHRTEHLNILLKGKLRVHMDGEVREITGPSLPFISKAGCRKATYAVEESTLITFHPTSETDLDKLEDELVEKSPIFQEMEAEGIIARLRGTPSTLEIK